MSRSLTSLDALRGFEAAARHLSFTLAARELFVTQSAISRQVQTLEEQLGVALFERRHRMITLTDAGQRLYRTAATALRELEATAKQIRHEAQSFALTVSCTLGFASLWLVPRLAGFQALYPKVDLRISASNQISDLERERIEVAIRYCPPAQAPSGSIQLFGEEAIPVCSPDLLNNPQRPLVRPEDLVHHVLLHLEMDMVQRPTTAWTPWLEMAGLTGLQPAGSLRFSHYDQLISAATQGHGVAICSTPLVARLVREGKLVTPFSQRLSSPRAYHVVVAPSTKAREEVRQLVAWLVEEAGAPESSVGAG